MNDQYWREYLTEWLSVLLSVVFVSPLLAYAIEFMIGGVRKKDDT